VPELNAGFALKRLGIEMLAITLYAVGGNTHVTSCILAANCK
jgi:hypothetical protein